LVDTNGVVQWLQVGYSTGSQDLELKIGNLVQK
jgi:hypothetical protein